MRCSNCGKENREGGKYCSDCGKPLEAEEKPAADGREVFQNPPDKTSDKRKRSRTIIKILAGALLLLIATGIAGGIVFTNRQEKKYDSYIADAEKYLEDMDYEKAEASYLEAIKIAPKEKEPYLRLSELYLSNGEIEKAKEIISEAKQNVASEEKAEIEEAEQELDSLTEYSWAVEPEIDADDIYYLKGYDYGAASVNETAKQTDSDYAVIRQGDSYGLIGMDGNLLEGMEYSSVGMILDYYKMTLKEPRYSQEYETDMTEFYLGDSGEVLPAVAVYSPDSLERQGVYYYIRGLKNSAPVFMGIQGFSWELKPLKHAIPVKEASETFDTAVDKYGADDAKWIDAQQSKYAIWRDGELQTDFIYEECGSESSGLLAVKQDGKWGYVNESGEVVIPLEYDASWQQYIPVQGEGAKDYCYAASGGYVPLVKDGKWEIRDTDGNLVIAPGIFEAIRPVHNGKCWVKKDGKWGVIQLYSAVENASASDRTEDDRYQDTSDNEKMTYLDELEIIASDQYSENEGDSFVYKIGEHEYSRGNVDINGNTYEHGLEGWIARWNYKDESSWAYSIFKLNSQYTSVNGKCVLIDSYNTEDFETTLEFWGDGNLLRSYRLTPETIPMDISIDLTNVDELKVYFYDTRAVTGGTSFGLTDMLLK